MKPNVLIIIATNNLSGPGKGIFQFLLNVDNNELDYTLCNYIQRGQETFEFLEFAKSKYIKCELLRQKTKYDISLIRQACSLYKKHGCNIVQSHGYKSHMLALILKISYGAKWVGMAHGWVHGGVRVKIYNMLEKILLQFPDYVITVSPQLYSKLRKKRSRPTKLIFNAVDPNEILLKNGKKYVRDKLSISKEEFLIGVFGRLSKEKGHIYIIEALNDLLKLQKNVSLLIVGEGAEYTKLKSLVDKLNLSRYVIFSGYTNQIGDYYAAVDLVVLPSLTEGLPNVVLEAMCAEKPVLATDVGAVKDIIKHDYNGWIVKPGSVIELTNAINQIINDRDKRIGVAKCAKENLYPKFSAKERARKILSVYNEILNY